MQRKHAQSLVLAAAVAWLLFTIVRIYETKLGAAPLNLKGNIATEGGMTANPPAN